MLFNALAISLAASAVSAISVQRRAQITDFETSPVSFAFPEARGFQASDAATAPCGGYAPGNRTSYPITGGDIALTQQTEAENVNILYTNEANPTKFHSFSTYSDSILEIGAGHFCQKAPDFAALGFKEGDDATLLVIYQLSGSSGFYYQCADINLVSATGFTTTEQYVCGNYTSTLDVASDEESLHLGNDASTNYTSSSTGSGSHSNSSSSTTSSVVADASSTAGVAGAGAESASSSSDSGLSAAAGGGIGAGVTIFVVAVLAGLLWFSGLLRFGRKKVQLQADHDSVSSGVPIKEHRV
ncbi:hypothetical protein IAT38_004001 [Cryptococcus sp. DSM 104549]